MKTITIGDIHGKQSWLSVEIKNFDKVIFIGDYTDSFDVSNVIIKKNLEDIIQLKKDNLDKIILLLGNHDCQYYFANNREYLCSGYHPEANIDLHELFKENKDLFQASYQVNNYLWTHAGVHQGWYEYRFSIWLEKYEDEVKILNLSEQLNKAFKAGVSCLFDVGHLRGGYLDVGGIFWADKRETYNKPLTNYHQIIGHTKVPGISHYDINDTTSVTYVDCLEFVDIPEFYELEIKEQNDII